MWTHNYYCSFLSFSSFFSSSFLNEVSFRKLYTHRFSRIVSHEFDALDSGKLRMEEAERAMSFLDNFIQIKVKRMDRNYNVKQAANLIEAKWKLDSINAPPHSFRNATMPNSIYFDSVRVCFSSLPLLLIEIFFSLRTNRFGWMMLICKRNAVSSFLFFFIWFEHFSCWNSPKYIVHKYTKWVLLIVKRHIWTTNMPNTYMYKWISNKSNYVKFVARRAAERGQERGKRGADESN